MTTVAAKNIHNPRTAAGGASSLLQKLITFLFVIVIVVLLRHPHVETIAVEIGKQAGIPNHGTLETATATDSSTTTTSTTTTTTPKSCLPTKGLRPIKNRNELGALLEEFRFTTGVEVGVQRGWNAKTILSRWQSCAEFHLVDLWAHQQNYVDLANRPDHVQDQFYAEAQANLKPWEALTQFHKMYSTQAAAALPKEHFDFVYLDARHDYCGVMEDIQAYWPLLKPGGIMAGHDFKSAAEVPNQDWSVCHDGTKNPGAVKGAVQDFMTARGVTVSVAYQDGDWPSWLVQKPMC